MAFWDKKMNVQNIQKYQEILSQALNSGDKNKIKSAAKKLTTELKNANSHISRNIKKEEKALKEWQKSLDKHDSGNDKDAKKSAQAAQKYGHYLEKIKTMKTDYETIIDPSNKLLLRASFPIVQPVTSDIVSVYNMVRAMSQSKLIKKS